jgi:hypothetical protein
MTTPMKHRGKSILSEKGEIGNLMGAIHGIDHICLLENLYALPFSRKGEALSRPRGLKIEPHENRFRSTQGPTFFFP